MNIEVFKEYYKEYTCPFCHRDDYRVKCKDLDREIVVCNTCGLYYAHPLMNSRGQEMYWQSYSSELNSNQYSMYINNPIDRDYSYIIRYILNACSIVDTDMLALDIGTFDGAFVYALNHFGF
ncbi:hypothetical protein MBAV_005723 [Candidatus Magnetobacterium bavaricum]|uniref:Uncharacterized protein n=1 Tax=Candidatus Magnetobacterium bavaricum TaxID=29290 RepID=A0A0F3GMZ9_9BACT|nr:hypothetical protein MBAV_005723 [Candidatus Magnetobacterium bavaricum]